ncbi:hypothetical protein GCM10023261_00740 [Bartonella jaculi]|uniref:Uncharacterized protein n=1 Tax=Bartonella jaculi TaxID=686226 RepID=A0ABP9MXL1_9HYPH
MSLWIKIFKKKSKHTCYAPSKCKSSHHAMKIFFLYAFFAIADWAAAKRAIGTRKGEHET